MPNDNQRTDVAVFIDFENVYVSVRDKLDVNPNFEMIMDRVEDLGRVVIARAYADWYRYPRVTSALYANGIEPMYVPTYYYDRDLGRTGRAIKNSVDMNLCIDAMKTLYTNPNISKFVLATGDRDFIPLVNSIRQQGKEVIIIGVGGAASAHLAQSADEFIFYEQLIGKRPQVLQQDQPRARMPEKGRESVESGETREPQREQREPLREQREPLREQREPLREQREPLREREPAREREPLREPAITNGAPTNGNGATTNGTPTNGAPLETGPDVYDTLVQAVHLARERGYVCSFGSLKLLMKELMGGDFKESKYKDPNGRPFAKFKDFALEAERRNKVQVFTSGAVNEVFLPGEDPYKLSQFAQDLKEEPPALSGETSDARIDGRSTSGRRRRRRRGGPRADGTTGDATLNEQDDLLEDGEEEDLPQEILAPSADETGDVDEVFADLLDRIEAEQAETQARTEVDPFSTLIVGNEAVEATIGDVEAPVSEFIGAQSAIEDTFIEPAPAVEPIAATQPVVDLANMVFTEEEWNILRDIVARVDRPVSFVQIHDSLRASRNTAGIVRTNEELRTLIKQAINSGVLERLGKGSRVMYRIATPVEPDQAELIATAAGDDTPSEEATPAAIEAATLPPEIDQTQLIAAAAVVEEPAAKAKPARRRKAAEPTPVVEAPAAEAPAAKAKPARRRKAAEPTPEVAAPVVKAPVAEAKPTRRRRTSTPKAEE